MRSLITLKALTFAPTGGMVAAPTTSLPEELGGSRNWDYRFCWLRDATLTLLALMNAGYYGEARAWRDWLLRAAAGAPAQLQIMYGLAGERRLTEGELAWLPGYEASRPVRIGNAAHGQLQLDVFGEVMDALHQARRGGIDLREEDWAFQRALLGASRRGLAAARRRHLGSARRPAALHALEGDGLGRLRSRHPGHRRRPASRGPSTSGARCARRSTTTCARTASIASWEASSSRTARRSSTPACCCCRPWASCRPPTSGCWARSPPSNGACSSTASCGATTRPRAPTACRAARACSWPAASGWRTPTSSPAAWTTPGACSSGCWPCATTWACCPRSTTRDGAACVGNFPQAFSHIALINTAHNLARAEKPAEQRST